MKSLMMMLAAGVMTLTLSAPAFASSTCCPSKKPTTQPAACKCQKDAACKAECPACKCEDHCKKA